MEKKWKIRLKWVKTKQGLRISHFFFFGRLGLYGKKSRFGTYVWKFGIHVWKILIHVWNFCMDLLVRKLP